MSGKPKNKGSSGKKTATRGKSAVKQYAAKGLKKATGTWVYREDVPGMSKL